MRAPYEANPNNSVIAFHDNSSAIRGFPAEALVSADPRGPAPLVVSNLDLDVTLTAETHNFPSGVAPFPGAETGTGGRIRDGHATGRGSLVVAGTAAYCVGNLRLPDYKLAWEDGEFLYPPNLAPPSAIEIEASNGASDYGNKFGEPVIAGFTRSVGLRLPGGERREWIKPIMFSGGIGQIDARHTSKEGPETSMWVVKIGGPAYRIGMGGGAASSMVQGDNAEHLDFNAVQRGDAEMEQKVNRVIRACSELGEDNPIVSIHDQGAGGNCNVLKEIVEPAGARLEIREIPVGDKSLSVLEIWGAEYQENDALLLRPQHEELFRSLCARERVEVSFVGRVTGDGRVIVHDASDGSTPVDLVLDDVLGEVPQKTFDFDRIQPQLEELQLPPDLTVEQALDRVLRLLSVGSKRFLTTKVDRSVSGLVARQQCVGPLQLTAADVAVIAQSHFGTTGGRHRDWRAASEGTGRSRRHGAHGGRRSTHQPRVGPGHRPRGRALLRQLDVGGKAPGRGCGSLRRRHRHERNHDRTRNGRGRRQRQSLHGGACVDPGRRRRTGQGARRVGDLGLRDLSRHPPDRHPRSRAARDRASPLCGSGQWRRSSRRLRAGSGLRPGRQALTGRARTPLC